MKYDNLEKCTQICERISKLKEIKERLESITPKTISLSNVWDCSSAFFKQWNDSKPPIDASSEDGLYREAIREFILDLIDTTQSRIELLESQLSEL